MLRLAALCTTLTLVSLAWADAWPVKHGDMHNTGRAAFVVPADRMDSSFFDVIRWQTPSPGGDSLGGFSSSAMVFQDGAGPGGADLVVAGYHWPKGVQGMDRHTGETFWFGNPAGGETIGTLAPAFSIDGSTIYVINDATGNPGHPLMAFDAATGPGSYWHNGNNPAPGEMSNGSPIIAPDGRIFNYAWVDRPYAAIDTGAAINHVWGAGTGCAPAYSGPALYEYGPGDLRVICGGRWSALRCWLGDDPAGTEQWSVSIANIEARPTVDPANGNVYVGAGTDSVWVVGVDKDGTALWPGGAAVLVHGWIPGANDPQRAQSAGCLSHDGGTYYFQTVSTAGDGRLYAIDTADGSLKWSYPTQSRAGEGFMSSPIVTPNGVVIVGNNEGNTFYALRDDGTAATLLDTLSVVDGGHGGGARVTPTLSADGMLYLPITTTWIASNGNGDTPSFAEARVFTAFDLNSGASMELPPPGGQTAKALNNAVKVYWRPVIDPTGVFDHYAIYRASTRVTDVSGLTPIATVSGIDSDEFVDDTAVNGTAYYYAVTSVTTSGGELTTVKAVGPRTPYDRTDLQVAVMSRTPRYPRYLPNYTAYQVTEPSGFGPYIFTAATSLGGGQTPATQRWPHVGDPVTYTATVRNAGTSTWSGTLSGTWKVAGGVVATPSQAVTLAPEETATFSYVDTWDDTLYELEFALDVNDDRPENDARTIQTKSVAFLTYIDLGYLEDFRAKTPDYPQAATDDMIDWLWRHAEEMNQMFADRGGLKRVHYGVLEVIMDGEPDPGIDRTPFAIFPFRYYSDKPSSDPRSPGYYHANVDIDYGLCHEMAHQLGLIDLYRLDVHGSSNQVSGLTRWATDGLMRIVSPFFSRHSALGMNTWIDKAHGYYGQYLYNMPNEVRLRIVGAAGRPVQGVNVTVYQKCERPGMGEVITDQVKAQGTTDAQGIWTLPNVPIDPNLVPTTPIGDTLKDNPFGYVAVVGTNGILHFKFVGGRAGISYDWLEISDVNVAYWEGHTDSWTFTRQIPHLQDFIPGDVNCDGLVDFDDINPFVTRLTDPDRYAENHPYCADGNIDVSGDGVVDFDDINPFVTLLTQ